VDTQILAQARDVNSITPDKFLRPIIDLIMCGYPGATFHLDFRLGIPKPIYEYYVALLPQADVRHVVHMHDNRSLNISPPTTTKTYPKEQPSQTTSAISRADFGEIVRGPLGWLVHARSGDKGSNANIGFFVRHRDEYDWMRSLLSTENMKALLAKEYNGKQIVSLLRSSTESLGFSLHDQNNKLSFAILLCSLLEHKRPCMRIILTETGSV